MPIGIKGFSQGNKYGSKKLGKNKVKDGFDYKAYLAKHRQANFDRLIELSQSNSRSIALEATKTLLAYDVGKPVQPIGNDPGTDKPFSIKVETTDKAGVYELLNKQNNT